MTLDKTLTFSIFAEGYDMFRTSISPSKLLHHTDVTLVPIVPLCAEHTQKILIHLQKLDLHDRYLRFGYSATDAQIKAYVEGLKFDRDEIFGIFNNELEIISIAHLALIHSSDSVLSSEFGVSVAAYARGRGYGARMFQRAVIHARNAKVYQMYIHALSENAPMIRIARKAGARIERDGSETEAYLSLPKRDVESRITEFVADQYAQTNYSIKKDAKRFWDFLSKVQEIRQDVRKGRHKAAE